MQDIYRITKTQVDAAKAAASATPKQVVYNSRADYETKLYGLVEGLDGRERDEYIAYETDVLGGILVELQGMRA